MDNLRVESWLTYKRNRNDRTHDAVNRRGREACYKSGEHVPTVIAAWAPRGLGVCGVLICHSANNQPAAPFIFSTLSDRGPECPNTNG